MLTINDLNLSIDFWKWLCGLTTTWIFAECDNEYGIMSIVRCIDIGIEYLSASQQELESIIYQAKDGLNDLFLLHKNENNFYEIMESSGVLIIQKSMIYSCPIPEHHIIYDEYENKTTARLAALKWIWEQVNKEE